LRLATVPVLSPTTVLRRTPRLGGPGADGRGNRPSCPSEIGPRVGRSASSWQLPLRRRPLRQAVARPDRRDNRCEGRDSAPLLHPIHRGGLSAPGSPSPGRHQPRHDEELRYKEQPVHDQANPCPSRPPDRAGRQSDMRKAERAESPLRNRPRQESGPDHEQAENVIYNRARHKHARPPGSRPRRNDCSLIRCCLHWSRSPGRRP
jgi:hypothetical protein